MNTKTTKVNLTEHKRTLKEIAALTALCEAQRRKISRLERDKKRLTLVLKRRETAVSTEDGI